MLFNTTARRFRTHLRFHFGECARNKRKRYYFVWKIDGVWTYLPSRFDQKPRSCSFNECLHFDKERGPWEIRCFVGFSLWAIRQFEYHAQIQQPDLLHSRETGQLDPSQSFRVVAGKVQVWKRFVDIGIHDPQRFWLFQGSDSADDKVL